MIFDIVSQDIVIQLSAMLTAYLDPGTGSILIQVLVGALAAIGIFLGTSWGRVKAFFRKAPKKDEEKPGNEQ